MPLPADPSLVRPILSRHLGVTRNGAAIDGAIAALLKLVDMEGAAADPAIVGLAIAVFATLRQESRGAHARSDFPLKLANAERRFMDLAGLIEFAREAASRPLARSA
jgi:L-aspartate oxidase